jgi:hypothetical protein
MQQIFVSNSGNDENDGLTRQTPVRSWKRVTGLRNNNEMFLMEGDSTLMRLKKEIDEAAERGDFGEGAFGEGPFGAG